MAQHLHKNYQVTMHFVFMPQMDFLLSEAYIPIFGLLVIRNYIQINQIQILLGLRLDWKILR